MNAETPPEVNMINEQAITDALDVLKNRSRLADPVHELREQERLCSIILGEARANIQAGLDYEPDEVASILSEVLSTPPIRLKLVTLRAIVAFLPSNHPLHAMLTEMKQNLPPLKPVDKQVGL